MLNFIWGSAYPEDVLKALFSMSLAYAVKGAEGMKIVADHFIFLLSARHLDYEIALHFKKIDNSTAETILTRFEMVDQSNKSKERPSICEESFVIDITAIDSGGKRKKLAGKGRPREFSVDYTIHQGATYGLTNNDNLCLFLAFEYLRMKFILPRQRFCEYKRAPSWQLNDVGALCRASDIDLTLSFYSVEEYGERIQAYYDHLHPGMFRLFCFETTGKMKPSWKSDVADYQHELCVLFTEGDDGAAGHYDAIKATGRLFSQKGNYCFGCEMPYERPTRHNASCKWKCHNCQRTFKCAECYEHHAKIVTRQVKRGKKTTTTENAICKSSKKCIDCGVIYQIRGPILGELTDEYPHHTIVEFVCAGPKAYALWLRDNNTGEDQYKMKLRGITLDSDACQQINYAKMVEMVVEKWGAVDNFCSFNYPSKNFRITKKGDIFTVPLVKRFNPTVNKGVIRDDGLRVVPFGYTDWEYCQLNNPHCCECQMFVPDPEYNFNLADLDPEAD
uniref:DNA-directed DNA polymerase n=1 Tax=Globodera pallida TaxID=36090 RepID=A0A183CPK8_GLOPA